MSQLKIKVPVTLTRNNDGFSLQVETSDGQAASISLSNHGPLIDSILSKWADERLYEAMRTQRRNTGLKDVTGTPVYEGDIVQRFDMPGHADVFGVVKWDADLAAFIMQGIWEDGTLWQSNNLQGVQAARIVGDIFRHPERLTPAKGGVQ